MPKAQPPKKTITERIAAGEFGEKRKRYGAPDTSADTSVDLYAAHARAHSNRDKREQPSIDENQPTWELMEKQRSEAGQLPLDKISRG